MAKEHKESISLNKADVETLLSKVHVLGPKRAQQIVDWRKEHGPFKNWDDVDAIPGFTPDMVNHLKEAGVTLD